MKNLLSIEEMMAANDMVGIVTDASGPLKKERGKYAQASRSSARLGR